MVSQQEKVSDMLLENRLTSLTARIGKRARLSEALENDSDSSDGNSARDDGSRSKSFSSKDARSTDLSVSSGNVGRRGNGSHGSVKADLPRAPSPAPSTSSSFSAATTSAALSSRASLSSCRSSRRSSREKGSSRSHSRPASASLSHSSYASASGRRVDGRRDRSSRRCVRSDRYDGRVYEMGWSSHRRRRSCYRSFNDRPRSRGFKRSRSRSVNVRYGSGRPLDVQCTRCLETCKHGEERTEITRTLPMEYWVRTPECKEAKARHMDYIDRVAYSREQFIEETVFTCPFTGVQRETLLERNMFPYDVPTDVEHWTLWSRRDLEPAEMERFVQQWVKENHPHVVEWECDNNEGDRSIEWYHVHVFFRLPCVDKSGAKRDPASVYNGPCGTPAVTRDRSSQTREE